MKKSIILFAFMTVLSIGNTQAQQEGFIGEVKMFAGNFAPRGWAFCEGQLLSIASNTALFSIIGTTYGGDGRTTFALPDLRGRAPIGVGHGPGLTTRNWGSRGGAEYNILTTAQLPAHNHIVQVVTSSAASVSIPVNTVAGDEDEANLGAGVLANTGNDNFSSESTQGGVYSGSAIPVAITDPHMITGNTGANSQINNMQPWLAMHYIICLQGVFPSRN